MRLRLRKLPRIPLGPRRKALGIASGLYYNALDMKLSFSAFFPIAVLLCFQLLGELCVRATGVPVSGALMGAVFLLAALFAIPSLHDRISTSCHTLIGNMLILYMPVSVGLMERESELKSNFWMLVVAVCLSTWLTALATGITFQAILRRVKA